MSLPLHEIERTVSGQVAIERGTIVTVKSAVERRLVVRRHVDYGRVRSAICPAR